MVDSKILAFFPWASISEPLSIGNLRLIPYEIGKPINNFKHVNTLDIDTVLSAYSDRLNRKIVCVTLLELGDWESGMADSHGLISEFFKAKDLIVTSALSRRKLFTSSLGYCNTDTFTLVVQRFVEGTSHFAFDTRRRDGGTTHMWATSQFSFIRPHHVDSNYKMNLDAKLLECLLSLPQGDPILESLKEFNCSNTDADSIPIYSEIVMMKSAFEWLFSIGERCQEFINSLNDALVDIGLENCEGALVGEWLTRWGKSKRLLEAWGREFCALRGVSAHGLSKSKSSLIWDANSHLAFASILFPLLLKKILSDKNLFSIDEYDMEKLKRIEQYLASNPFEFNANDSEWVHPWLSIEEDVRNAQMENFFENH